MKVTSAASASRVPLPPLSGRKWGTVVQVGGGPGALALSARRLVLLDGDPVNCARLRAAARGRSGVQVRERVVAPVAGPVTWHLHSWPAADGLQDMTPALGAIYPRLQLLARRDAQAQSLTEVLEDLAPDRLPDEANALVLDLPSGADNLVRGLSAEWALCFDWIVAGGLPDDSTAIPPYLHAQAWPDSIESRRWRAWRVDPEAYRMQVELDQTRAELDGTRKRLIEAQAQGSDLEQRLAEGEQRERDQSAQLAERVGMLVTAQEQLAARATEIERLEMKLQAVMRAESKLDLIADLLLAARLK